MMIPALDPCLFDLKSRRVIYVKCRCGHEACLLPVRLVGKHGIKWHTKVFGLQNRLKWLEVQAPAGAAVDRQVAGESSS